MTTIQIEDQPKTRPRLALYVNAWCGYCFRVRRVIAAEELDIPLRDIAEPEHLRALVEATGRRTVPVLRIVHADEREHWMPESRDIITYLRGLAQEVD